MLKPEILVIVAGLLANLVWLIVNLRIDAVLSRRIERLKDEMADEYVPLKLCDERHRCRYPSVVESGR